MTNDPVGFGAGPQRSPFNIASSTRGFGPEPTTPVSALRTINCSTVRAITAWRSCSPINSRRRIVPWALAVAQTALLLAPSGQCRPNGSQREHHLCSSAEQWGRALLGQQISTLNWAFQTPTLAHRFQQMEAFNQEAIDLALGDQHTLVLTPAGAIHCWGKNGQGQCGLDNTIQPTTPSGWLERSQCRQEARVPVCGCGCG